MGYQYHDGGRQEAGYTGRSAEDCVVRAIAIAENKPYRDVYTDLGFLYGKGVAKKVWHKYLINALGYTWTACMHIGSGCRVHLRAEELPKGRIICRLSRHLVAVIDGIIMDISDCSRNGTRCVYGYYQKQEPESRILRAGGVNMKKGYKKCCDCKQYIPTENQHWYYGGVSKKYYIRCGKCAEAWKSIKI